ncbi:SRPBCC domain-containing protein [Aquariibacter albus]|uniref:SRPBCC domain-containing protein n=1 Tax=Aquariibacter albus TaxID=2759899 RepID=A0A839HIP9_9BURK|nr:SRPBCC domain-containing protein [Aquariibacter albus]MBB1161773.1 SRPBCC domain-containing protein [Aquariibacter albus]
MPDTPAPGSLTLHRMLRAPAERIYRAWTDPQALMKWMPPHGFIGIVHAADTRPGGAFRMGFTQLGSGEVHTWQGRYLELVLGERIVTEEVFDSPDLPGTLRTEVNLRPTPSGTELRVTQSGLPDALTPESCMLGWQDSLQLLALLVEGPDMPPAAEPTRRA